MNINREKKVLITIGKCEKLQASIPVTKCANES